jgi:regulatory protein
MARTRRPPAPLDPSRLEELALAYVARFATSRAKLEGYLARKLRERGWDSARPPQVAELAERFVAAGYIDDEAYARSKAGSLMRRGYGMRRVGQALGAAGIASAVREKIAPDEAERRSAALTMLRKRRFGPFAAGAIDRALREKQIAAMLRAGHALDHVIALIDAAGVGEAEDWAQGEDHE